MDYFEGFREWDAVKWLFIAFHIALTFICPSLLCSIIWYENSGCDAHYRTVVNILLSHLCNIMLHLFLWARLPYLIIIIFGPFPMFVCEITTMLTKWGFLCIITEFVLWQLMKYMFIFQWQNVVSMDDDFVALFLTGINLFINFLYTITMYMIGFANSEMEFHVCTGRNPILNLNETIFATLNPLEPDKVIQIMNDHDFSKLIIFCFFVVLVLTSFRIWVYDKKPKMQIYYSKMMSIIQGTSNARVVGMNLQEDDPYDYLSKTKSIIIGASGSFVIGMLIFLLAVPPNIAKRYVNIDSLNHGKGRTMYYLSRMSITVLRYCSLPIVTFCSSRKIRECVWMKLKSLISFRSRTCCQH